MGLDLENVDLKEDEPKPDVSIDQETATKLIADLEAAGIITEEDLQGKLQASQQTGHLANQLGETREQVRELQDKVANQNIQSKQGPTDDIFNSFEQPQQGISEDRIIELLDKRDAKKTQEATQARRYVVAQYNAITGNKYYPVVKATWEAKMRDPVFANAIDTGQINPISAYQETVIEFLSGVNAKTLETLKGVIKTPGENEEVDLHLEEGGRVIEPSPSLPGTKIEPTNIQKYQDHVNKGGKLTEQDELNLLKEVFKE